MTFAATSRCSNFPIHPSASVYISWHSIYLCTCPLPLRFIQEEPSSALAHIFNLPGHINTQQHPLLPPSCTCRLPLHPTISTPCPARCSQHNYTDAPLVARPANQDAVRHALRRQRATTAAQRPWRGARLLPRPSYTLPSTTTTE